MADPSTSGDQPPGDGGQRPAGSAPTWATPDSPGGAGADAPPWARTTAQSPWATDRRAQWARPYDYPPAWGPQPGYAAEPGSSPLAVIAATVLIVLGALVTLGSVVMLAVGAAGDELLDQTAAEAGLPSSAGLATLILVIAAFMLVVGILHMVAAIGVFTHKEWARWLGIALATLGLALGGLMALGIVADPTADLGSWLIAVVWLGAYVAALAGLAAGGEQFQAARSRRQ